MTALAIQTSPARPHLRPVTLTDADRQRYVQLQSGFGAAGATAAADLSRPLVGTALQRVQPDQSELPPQPTDLLRWSLQQHEQVHRQFSAYREARQRGGARQYFPTRAHALLFLQRVAPTKLVDGAWLQGLTPLWRDSRLHTLLQTYLDELGRGQPTQNHVVLYRHLMQRHEIDLPEYLPDALFTQGLAQLALGHHGPACLPELVGFNLGYEQLPLHLLITAHELNELGIDPYYFTLHVTVDNAATGHARQALDSIAALWPDWQQDPLLWQRIRHGHALNQFGLGSTAVARGLDLQAAVLEVLQEKAVYGRLSHSDRCRIQGKTLNDWLHSADSTAELVALMQHTGWIRRHSDPQHSRFWRLLSGTQPLMQGVFSQFELQLIHDWIAGDWLHSPEAPRSVPFHRQSAIEPGATVPAPLPEDAELAQLLDGLKAQRDPAAQLDWLAPWLFSPGHARPAGLEATRRFQQLWLQQPC